ncbi:MAG: hypothetical protein V1915_01675 [Candidatus Bathyarchaeota archaeon]
MSSLNTIIKSFKLDEIEKILSALSSEDALKILIAAKEGITKSTDTIKELELTQRRYYVRLNELMKAGLIEKVEECYQLTLLGKVCYDLGQAFNTTLNNRERLDLADRLRKSKSISLEETKQILQALSSKGIIGSLGFSDIIQPVKMIDNYETLVSELVDRIEKAQTSISLASCYTDTRALEALLRAFERGVKISGLSGSNKGIIERLQVLRMILNPNMIKVYAMFLDGRIKVKSSEFPFSFCIIDEKDVIIELPNPISNEFYLGFSLQNEEIGKRLLQSFDELYKEGKENIILSQIFGKK